MKSVLIAILVLGIPLVAHAKDCELPHEWLESQCQVEEGGKVSGILKAEKRSLKELMDQYQQKVQEADALVFSS